MSDKTEAEVVADLARISVHYVGDYDRAKFAFVPDDMSVVSLEEYQARPNQTRADIYFSDVASLAAYLARFEVPQSIALAKQSSNTIRVAIDYHDHMAHTPSHCTHHATFVATYSDAYEAWRRAYGKTMSQVAAGQFLEERAVDVIEPDSADIMDMVMTFEALKKVDFRQSMRLHDGRRQFQYTEENEARGQMTLPERIKIRVPVFDGMEPDVIPVRVRYRIEDTSLKFAFEIHDHAQVERTAFERCEHALKVARPNLLILRSAAKG